MKALKMAVTKLLTKLFTQRKTDKLYF